ncbi:fluoride efflux transporter FluC [Halalkalibacter nanhaiisediminis]|uniref:Fluoride-specific ion channel FluC n=1 Tax=Halalkalibacter nanhaiisediminis TaxID=688079 RepID=A0A562QB02_9BACI|nr:CrcB family protein [Halalkalibacter nanhaiisediminis]TWI53941.1 camphor resistance protein CrcB [Halalkalibacter nanhaiisediminis]
MKCNLLKNIVAIMIGAAVGTSLRYYLNLSTVSTGYPIGTLIENMSGSLLLGLLTGWFIYKVPREWVKTGLGVGLCGGFTTMSTLAADSVSLTVHHTWWLSLIYLVVSVFGGVGSALGGFLLGQKLGLKRSQQEVGEA